MKVTSLRPVHDYLLLEIIGLEGSGALTVVEVNETLREICVVKAIGEGRIVDGKLFPFAAQPGQMVLIPPRAGIKIELDGRPHTLLKSEYILGVVSAEKNEYERYAEDLQSTPTTPEEEEQHKAMREILGRDIPIIKAPMEKVTEVKTEDKPVIKDTTKEVKQTPVKEIKTGKPKMTPTNTAVKNAMKQKDIAGRKVGQAAQRDKK